MEVNLNALQMTTIKKDYWRPIKSIWWPPLLTKGNFEGKWTLQKIFFILFFLPTWPTCEMSLLYSPHPTRTFEYWQQSFLRLWLHYMTNIFQHLHELIPHQGLEGCFDNFSSASSTLVLLEYPPSLGLSLVRLGQHFNIESCQ